MSVDNPPQVEAIQKQPTPDAAVTSGQPPTRDGTRNGITAPDPLDGGSTGPEDAARKSETVVEGQTESDPAQAEGERGAVAAVITQQEAQGVPSGDILNGLATSDRPGRFQNAINKLRSVVRGIKTRINGQPKTETPPPQQPVAAATEASVQTPSPTVQTEPTPVGYDGFANPTYQNEDPTPFVNAGISLGEPGSADVSGPVRTTERPTPPESNQPLVTPQTESPSVNTLGPQTTIGEAQQIAANGGTVVLDGDAFGAQENRQPNPNAAPLPQGEIQDINTLHQELVDQHGSVDAGMAAGAAALEASMRAANPDVTQEQIDAARTGYLTRGETARAAAQVIEDQRTRLDADRQAFLDNQAALQQRAAEGRGPAGFSDSGPRGTLDSGSVDITGTPYSTDTNPTTESQPVSGEPTAPRIEMPTSPADAVLAGISNGPRESQGTTTPSVIDRMATAQADARVDSSRDLPPALDTSTAEGDQPVTTTPDTISRRDTVANMVSAQATGIGLDTLAHGGNAETDAPAPESVQQAEAAEAAKSPQQRALEQLGVEATLAGDAGFQADFQDALVQAIGDPRQKFLGSVRNPGVPPVDLQRVIGRVMLMRATRERVAQEFGITADQARDPRLERRIRIAVQQAETSGQAVDRAAIAQQQVEELMLTDPHVPQETAEMQQQEREERLTQTLRQCEITDSMLPDQRGLVEQRIQDPAYRDLFQQRLTEAVTTAAARPDAQLPVGSIFLATNVEYSLAHPASRDIPSAQTAATATAEGTVRVDRRAVRRRGNAYQSQTTSNGSFGTPRETVPNVRGRLQGLRNAREDLSRQVYDRLPGFIQGRVQRPEAARSAVNRADVRNRNLTHAERLQQQRALREKGIELANALVEKGAAQQEKEKAMQALREKAHKEIRRKGLQISGDSRVGELLQELAKPKNGKWEVNNPETNRYIQGAIEYAQQMDTYVDQNPQVHPFETADPDAVAAALQRREQRRTNGGQDRRQEATRGKQLRLATELQQAGFDQTAANDPLTQEMYENVLSENIARPADQKMDVATEVRERVRQATPEAREQATRTATETVGQTEEQAAVAEAERIIDEAHHATPDDSATPEATPETRAQAEQQAQRIIESPDAQNDAIVALARAGRSDLIPQLLTNSAQIAAEQDPEKKKTLLGQLIDIVMIAGTYAFHEIQDTGGAAAVIGEGGH